MTDKQIIIDGVDVSGCEFLNKTRHCKAHMSIMGTDTNKCKCFPNCYYKQLKRKEQECEQKDKDIKFLIKCLDNSFKTRQDSELHWERERKELKAELEPFKDEYFKGLDNITIAELAKKSIRITAENCKLEQTLTEIKEIAEDVIKNVSDRCIEITPMYGIHKQILQKISEVIK